MDIILVCVWELEYPDIRGQTSGNDRISGLECPEIRGPTSENDLISGLEIRGPRISGSFVLLMLLLPNTERIELGF